MDSAPLNLAHFHERRAEKFLRHNNYDDALKAIDCALLYLQDAYKCVRIPKAIEVLDTQKWDLERKLRQIQIRKQQHERGKLKEIVPTTKKETVTSVITFTRPENSVTAQCVAKSIDKTIRDMGAKLNSSEEQLSRCAQQQKENADPKMTNTLTFAGGSDDDQPEQVMKTEILKTNKVACNVAQSQNDNSNEAVATTISDCDLPTLAPLELPTFDFDVFTATTATTAPPPITTITGLAESFQK